MSGLTITTIEELKEIAAGKVIEISGWNDTPFVCKVRRPNLQVMCTNGDIPNSLLGVATDLFAGGKPVDKSNLLDLIKMQIIMVKATLVEPSYEALEEAGVQLTDPQMGELFNYAMYGLSGLENFRKEQEHLKNSKPSKRVQAKAK